MSFSVEQGSPRIMRIPVDTVNATTLTVGQLVKAPVAFNGVGPLAVASGAGDGTGLNSVFGVVVGTSDFKATYTTYGQYITTTAISTQAHQTARTNLGNFGMWVKGDPQEFVDVAILDATMLIRGSIYNGSTPGVAPTLNTATAVTALGVGMTVSPGADVAPTAQLSTTYCRTGRNAGIYRVNLAASGTAMTFTTQWPYNLAVGDTFVTVPYRVGDCYAQLNSLTSYIGLGFDCSVASATNYFLLRCLELDLATAGKETILFQFNPQHFYAAVRTT